MSPSRAPRPTASRRTPYKAPRDRRELYVAIGVAVLIVVVTATLVWFLRPNRDSGPDTTSTPVATSPTTLPTDTTATPTDSTAAPTDTTASPSDTTVVPEESTTSPTP